MNWHFLIITLSSFGILSVALNFLLIWYSKNTLSKINEIHNASEAMSEIFSYIDAYRDHLKSVYEMPTFYGDQTLQNLLEHSGQVIEYLKKYESVYSFTQPELEKMLLEASEEFEDFEKEEEKEG